MSVEADPAVLEGLEHWRTLPVTQQPAWPDADALARVGARQHEPFGVESDAGSRKPIRLGVRPDEKKQMPDVPANHLARAGTPADGIENAIVTFETRNLRLRYDLDVCKASNTVHQVLRHARRDIAATSEKPNFGGLARQIDSGLSCRISCADQDDFILGTELSFQRRGPIMQAAAFEFAHAIDTETPVAHAACDDDRTRVDALIIG